MTGVIVGADINMPTEAAVNMRELLEQRFPGVRFAVVPGVHSVAFEFEGDDDVRPR